MWLYELEESSKKEGLYSEERERRSFERKESSEMAAKRREETEGLFRGVEVSLRRQLKKPPP